VFSRLSELRKALTFYAIIFALVVTASLLPLGQVPDTREAEARSSS
jgi:hypothetical protein